MDENIRLTGERMHLNHLVAPRQNDLAMSWFSMATGSDLQQIVTVYRSPEMANRLTIWIDKKRRLQCCVTEGSGQKLAVRVLF